MTVKVVRQWHMLPREGVYATSLEVFKVGWGFEQAGIVESVPTHGRGVETR